MPNAEQLRAFPWSSLTWLIVNEGELRELLVGLDQSSPEDSDSKDVSNVAAKNLKILQSSSYISGKLSILCTLGAQGAMYLLPTDSKGQSETGHLPAAKLRNPLRDTTGAGDCFAGYFVAGLMRGLSLNENLNTCLHVGPNVCPTC